MIERVIVPEVRASAAEYPVVTIVGPRQAGKTTLVRGLFPDKPYYSLEEPDVRAIAAEDPRGFLDQAPEGAILDEVQRLPELLSYLQGRVDTHGRPGMYILTGSHQPRLQEAIAQSLAGRTAVLELWPFSLPELRHYRDGWRPFELVVSGFFPRVHEYGLEPRRFYNGYLQTYVERDVRALINLKDLTRFQRFLVLLAGRIGQIVNYASLASDVGVSSATIKSWLSVLRASYVVFELPPFAPSVRKRIVKSPKIYFTDVGLAAFLLGIETETQAARDPLRGNLYENLVIAELVKGALNRGMRPRVYFYRDAHGHEVDLVVAVGGRLVPIEIKSAATFVPEFIRGLDHFASLGLAGSTRGFVLYSGERAFTVRGVRVRDPLRVPDLWAEVTADPETS